MSTTLGPPLPLDGPLPVAPAHSLLAAATIVPSDARHGVGGAIWPYPPGLPEAWDPCSAGTFRTKKEGQGWELPEFQSFEVYLPITCSSITAHSPGFADRVLLAFAATESFAVASELARGVASGGMNPFLLDGNLNILNAGTAVNPDYGLGLLEDAIGATGRGGMILTTPAAGAALNGTGGFGLETRSGALVTTANATPVALDGGFIGASPSLHPVLNTGEAWAFATGPVQIRRADNIDIVADLRSSLDRADNTVTFRAERSYLVTWDTQLQAGVLIDLTGCVLC